MEPKKKTVPARPVCKNLRTRNFYKEMANRPLSELETEERKDGRRELRQAYEDFRVKQIDDTSFVYFMQSIENRRIKIGYAKDVLRRRSDLEVGHGGRLAILVTTPGGITLESQLHRQFEEHRVFGEWFEPHPDIMSYVEALLVLQLARHEILNQP